MKDRKAAKRIIKLAKKHPDWYTEQDITYAKLFRRANKKNAGSEINNRNSTSRRDDGLRGKSQQPAEPRQPKRSWFTKVLHKAWALVRL